MFRLGLLIIACLGLVAITGPEDADAGCFANMRARRQARIEARAQGYGFFGRASYGCSGPQQMNYGCSGPQQVEYMQQNYVQPQQYNAPRCINGNCIVPEFSEDNTLAPIAVPISTAKDCNCVNCDCVDCDCNAFKIDNPSQTLLASNVNPGF